MKIERSFSNPNVIKMLQTIDEEVLALFAEALDRKVELQNSGKKPTLEVEKEEPELSKWALFAKEIEQSPIDLGDYTEEDRRIRKEFRENFTFQHDIEKEQ